MHLLMVHECLKSNVIWHHSDLNVPNIHRHFSKSSKKVVIRQFQVPNDDVIGQQYRYKMKFHLTIKFNPFETLFISLRTFRLNKFLAYLFKNWAKKYFVNNFHNEEYANCNLLCTSFESHIHNTCGNWNLGI